LKQTTGLYCNVTMLQACGQVSPAVVIHGFPFSHRANSVIVLWHRPGSPTSKFLPNHHILFCALCLSQWNNH